MRRVRKRRSRNHQQNRGDGRGKQQGGRAHGQQNVRGEFPADRGFGVAAPNAAETGAECRADRRAQHQDGAEHAILFVDRNQARQHRERPAEQRHRLEQADGEVRRSGASCSMMTSLWPMMATRIRIQAIGSSRGCFTLRNMAQALSA